MLVWLSKQPGWANARKIRFSREALSVSSSALGPYEPEDNDAIRDLRFVPKTGFTYSCWFKRHYLTVGRAAPTSTESYDHDYDGGYLTPAPFYGGVRGGFNGANLFISIVAWNTSIILDLLREAQKAYAATLIHGTNVYTAAFNNVHWGSNDSGQWKLSSTTPKRSFDSIVLDPAIKDLLLQDAISFLSNRAWYSERCIPFRRGYLLYVPPGSGKTSFISAIAGELGLDVYIISLSQAGMDDAGLTRLFNDLPGNCIALIEDIDAAFTRKVNRDALGNDLPGTMVGWPPVQDLGVSLSGLLNALDGIGAKEGRILFATTNKYESLDKALSRPGRMDLHVEFKLAAKYQAEGLFKRFYNPRGSDLAEDDKESTSNGLPVVHASSSVPSCVTVMDKLHTTRVLRLSQSRLQELADAFAEAIPEHEFSMASIQGYLMAYKTDPVAAAAAIKDWVHETRSDASDKTDLDLST
ncbi:P-loop containing nucleoside triphosphate hydrolase protein [Hymenopellis radicata]|nr:P-loop containing nucleoside triphosphate hydrolase protein [Hymenopellis radicata]